jgi:hypothetical protein
MNDTQSTIIPIIGYVDATTPDLTIHSPVLEEWARAAPALFRMGDNECVCSQPEMKQYVTQNLTALRQDIERDVDGSDEEMEASHEFYTLLCDLALRLELIPDQQAVVCDARPHAWLNPPDELLVLAPGEDASGFEICRVSELTPGERARFEVHWRQFVAHCWKPHRTVGELMEAGEWPGWPPDEREG